MPNKVAALVATTAPVLHRRGFDSLHTFSLICDHAKDLLQFCANMLPKIPDEMGTRLLMVLLRY
jgi:hypothetical protein